MWYRFNIVKFAEQMLPPILRKGVLVALLTVLVTPLKTLYEAFTTYRNAVLDRLNINGHVLPLEMALNKACYTDLIYIESQNVRHKLFIYNEAEGQQPTYIYKEAEGGPQTHLYFEANTPSDVNFIVYIPRSICTSLTDKAADTFHWHYLTTVKNLLNRYKAAGTTYEIRLIS